MDMKTKHTGTAKSAALKLIAFLLAVGVGFLLASSSSSTTTTSFANEMGATTGEASNNNTQRRLGISKALNKAKNEAKKYKKAASDAKNEVTKYKNLYNKYKNEATKYKNDATKKATDVANKAKEITNLKKEITGFKNKISSFTRQVSSLTQEVNRLKSVEKTLNTQVNKVGNTLESLPKQIENTIVKPILKKTNSIHADLSKIEDIADSVADSTVDALKKLDFLPKTGADLAKYMGDAVLDFLSQDFCIPYDCIANKFGIDINKVELYKSKRMTVTTALTPKTCLQVEKVAFDDSKLGQFLDLFKDLDALEDIFDEVKSFIKDQMDDIVDLTDDVEVLINGIESIANNAVKTMNFNRRLVVAKEGGEPVSMEYVSAMAYQKGHEKFTELYGEHVSRVFQERRLAENGGAYIGFKSLTLRFTQDFGQTLTLTAEDRAGYSGSLFDESMHQEAVFPVPFTGGMVKIVTTGSMETSLPYTMAMEAQGTAEFGYNVGEFNFVVDMVSGDFNHQKQPFTTDFGLDASIGVSGSMALNFAASAGIGICLGPSQDACLTVTIDTKQSSAAGFDALAGVSLDDGNTLTAMYTDVLEYDQTPNCDGDLTVGAGYWQYVEEPSVKVSITSTNPCSTKNDVLYEREGGLLQDSIDNFCLDIDILDIF